MTLRYAALGTGAGRPHGRPKGVQHVETVPCAATLMSEPHSLTNRGSKTVCEWCGETWAALDAELRGRS